MLLPTCGIKFPISNLIKERRISSRFPRDSGFLGYYRPLRVNFVQNSVF